jgi:hypothetical protein
VMRRQGFLSLLDLQCRRLCHPYNPRQENQHVKRAKTIRAVRCVPVMNARELTAR